MIKRVLIVDDDQEMLLSLKEGLSKFIDTFSVSIAGDGTIALEKLARVAISLVVTDLKMPGIDGFSLLSRIMENYPDIPVIIMTGYSTPEMRRLAVKGGAVRYIEKPFLIEDLGRKIITILRKESDGGTLHSVSSAMFLQLVEMEEQTCTIRLADQSSDRQGVLFFQKGELIHARAGKLSGDAAAYEIFSWDRVNLSIQNDCSQKKRTIYHKLQAVYLEAMRLKDEAGASDNTLNRQTDKANATGATEFSYDVDQIRMLLEKEIGKGCGIGEVYKDVSWNAILSGFEKIGSVLGSGRLKLGFVDTGGKDNFILLPGNEATVVSVRHKCPRDKIIQILSE